MEARIKERYNDTILQEAMRRYGIEDGQIQLLDGFESFIYEYQRGTELYILRIAHSLRRTENLIQAEADWINHLARGGASVASALPSQQDQLVESIDDGKGGHFLATAFTKAAGKPPWEYGWSPELYETYGQLLGKIHALSKEYVPSNPAWKRPQWDEAIMLEVGHLPASDALIVEKFDTLMVHLQALPREADAYGLIHFDAHATNFLVDGSGKITLFDFDDCAYCWFAKDIAMVLFYKVMGHEDDPSYVPTFLQHFLRGYRQEYQLDARWLKELPHFMKLREIDLYAVIHRSFDLENLDDPWVERYMNNRKQKIENDVPYIDFDFGSLAGEL